MDNLKAIGDNIEFEMRLAETIAWCVPRANAADPKNSLRYDNWQPHILNGDRISIVNTILHSRSTWLWPQKLRSVQSVDDLKEGRLLVYFPDAELADGAAEAASRGFFDLHNTPPRDTWVGFFQDAVRDNSGYDIYLVAYVPATLVKVASDGIEVNPEESIAWVVNSRTTMRNYLSERNLLT